MDIPELTEIKKQFRYKYGKKFEQEAMDDSNETLNARIVAKLSVQPPSAFLVQTYLEKIADQFEVEWKPAVRIQAEDMAQPMAAPVGYSVQVAPGTGLAPAYVVADDGDVAGPNQQSGMGMDIGGLPPPIPPSKAGMDSASSSAASYQNNIPVAQTMPMPYAPPAPSLAPSETRVENDLNEPDIVIPPAPGMKGSSSNKMDESSVNNQHGGNGNDEDDDDDHTTGAESYADLQARFSKLKK